jgi:hypothetical protein
MSTKRSLAALLAGAALVATAAAALAQEDDDAPKKGGHLAVSVSQVGPRAAVQQPLHIGSRLTWTGGKADFSYAWTSVGDAGLPSGVDDSSDALDIRANSLTPGTSYHFRLQVVARTEQGLEITASSDVKFKANEAPRGGTCKLATKATPSGMLQITLSAPGWTDPDGQVQYRFAVMRGKQVLAVQNWKAFTSFTTALMPKQGDVLVGRCGIRDELGDGTSLDTQPFGPGG